MTLPSLFNDVLGPVNAEWTAPGAAGMRPFCDSPLPRPVGGRPLAIAPTRGPRRGDLFCEMPVPRAPGRRARTRTILAEVEAELAIV